GIEQEFLPMCQELELSVVIYNPLAGGMLTGKHKPDQSYAGTRFDKMPAYKDRYWHDANFAAVDTLVAAARAADRSLVSLSLGWLLQRPGIDGIILGASNVNQLQENLAAFN